MKFLFRLPPCDSVFVINSEYTRRLSLSAVPTKAIVTISLSTNREPFYVSGAVDLEFTKGHKSFALRQLSVKIPVFFRGLCVRIWSLKDPSTLVLMHQFVMSGKLRQLTTKEAEKIDWENCSNGLLFENGEEFYTDANENFQLPPNEVIHSTAHREMYSPTALARLLSKQRAILQSEMLSADYLEQLADVFGNGPAQQLRVKLQEKLAVTTVLEQQLETSNSRYLQLKAELDAFTLENQQRYKRVEMKIEKLQDDHRNLLTEKEKCVALREQLLRSRTLLVARQKHLLHALTTIYPIANDSQGNYCIRGIVLPKSSRTDLLVEDEANVAVSVGYVAHLVVLLSRLWHVPLPHGIKPMGSRAIIEDRISPQTMAKRREYRLHMSKVPVFEFISGLLLLNKNIRSLRQYFSLPDDSLEDTLKNLLSLIHFKLSLHSGRRQLQPVASTAAVSERTTSGRGTDDEAGRRKRQLSFHSLSAASSASVYS